VVEMDYQNQENVPQLSPCLCGIRTAGLFVMCAKV